MAEMEMAVMAALLTQRDKIRRVQLELGPHMERPNMVDLEFFSAAAGLAGGLPLEMGSADARPRR
jgi:hypothetical protein